MNKTKTIETGWTELRRTLLTRVLEYSVGSVDLEKFGFISRVLVGMQLQC